MEVSSRIRRIASQTYLDLVRRGRAKVDKLSGRSRVQVWVLVAVMEEGEVREHGSRGKKLSLIFRF